MKAKITKEGFLEIERKGKFKKQVCPFNSLDTKLCGDWCPLFDETPPKFSRQNVDIYTLDLCHTILNLNEPIIDER